MAFSLFTKRADKPSSRLLAVATYLNFSAVMSGFVVAGIIVANVVQKFMGLNESFRPTVLVSVALGAVSLYQISRGLMRRERWAAYLAGGTFAAPLLRQLIVQRELPSLSAAIIPTLALCTILSVWNELGTVRDNEFDGSDDDDNARLKRNRGFGEGRARISPPVEASSTKSASIDSRKTAKSRLRKHVKK